MNRLSFIKSIFAGTIISTITKTTTATTATITATTNRNIKEFAFDELFIIHEGNQNLIYPRINSDVYKSIESIFKDRVFSDRCATYLPVRSLMIPVKDFYTEADFLPIRYYFESEEYDKYTTEMHGCCFRFIKQKEDRMQLSVFLYYNR